MCVLNVFNTLCTWRWTHWNFNTFGLYLVVSFCFLNFHSFADWISPSQCFAASFLLLCGAFQFTLWINGSTFECIFVLKLQLTKTETNICERKLKCGLFWAHKIQPQDQNSLKTFQRKTWIQTTKWKMVFITIFNTGEYDRKHTSFTQYAWNEFVLSVCKFSSVQYRYFGQSKRWNN